MQTVGFLGPAFFLSQLSGVDSVYAAVACMMGAQGLDAFSQSGLYSNHQDIGPRCGCLCTREWLGLGGRGEGLLGCDWLQWGVNRRMRGAGHPYAHNVYADGREC